VSQRLPESAEVTAFHLGSEAHAGAAEHAQASVVHVDAHLRNGLLHLAVRDDGAGGAAARAELPASRRRPCR
jgi:signal transduction histidine kinase